MEIRQEFTIDHDIARVWRGLGDVRLVASCMPGAEVVSISDDQRQVEGRIRARVGPIGAAFSGIARITRDDAAHRGTVEGTGLDQSNGSRAAVKLTYALAPASDGRATTTTVIAAVSLSGLLAQFGKSGLINDIATQMTREFSRRLQSALTAAPSATTDNPALPPAPADAGNDIRLLSVLFGLLKDRIARLFGRSANRNTP